MEWRDNGIILGLHRLGEHDARLELLTPAHGRAFGVVKGALSRKRRGGLQPGTTVEAVWRARLESHLGVFTVEPVRVRTVAFAGGPTRLAAMTSCCALASALLAERDPHSAIYQGLEAVFDLLDAGGEGDSPTRWAPAVVHWELGLLAEVGSGLDLAACAATGETGDLVYVSPKSGRAVSRDAGAPYRDRLLPLPSFLTAGGKAAQSLEEVAAGFTLTGYFLESHLVAHDQRGLPEARRRLAERIAAAAAKA